MNFEVEQKYRSENLEALRERLAALGADFHSTVEQTDHYFRHPCRDFAVTDEALRIRLAGDGAFITYKGPKLDSTTKTRKEIELPLHPGDPRGERFAEVLAALGFSTVAVVRKVRRGFRIVRGEHTVEGALDEVAGVGTFAELELMAGEEGLDEAKKVIGDLGAQLGLGPTERRSYLELLLDR